MSENKYETRVREIAEEMAKELFPYSYGTKHLGEVDYKCHEEKVKHFLPAARIAVKHMVGTAERYYQHGWLRGKKGFPVATEEEIELDFIARGLMPTPERKEAGENYAD